MNFQPSKIKPGFSKTACNVCWDMHERYLIDLPRFSELFFIEVFESSLLTNSTDFELDGPKLLSKSASKSASL